MIRKQHKIPGSEIRAAASPSPLAFPPSCSSGPLMSFFKESFRAWLSPTQWGPASASPTAPWQLFHIRGKENCLCKVCQSLQARREGLIVLQLSQIFCQFPKLKFFPVSCRHTWCSCLGFQLTVQQMHDYFYYYYYHY